MKIVFIAGPFRAGTIWEIEQNVRRAEACALEIWRFGCVAVCPHTNSRFFQDAAPDGVFLRGYKELLVRCDGVFLMPDWKNSFGTQEEVELAQLQGIPVFSTLAGLKEWKEG